VLVVAGNTAQVDSSVFAADGTTILQAQQAKYQVRSGASFRSETGLLELSIDTTSTFTNATANGPSAGTTVGPINVKSFSRITATETLNYGVTAVISAGPTTFNTLTFLTPALNLPTSPVLGTPYSRTYSSTVEITGLPSQPPASQTVITTYLGIEQVSVPAGTFSACKQKADTTTAAGVTTTSFSYTVASGRLKGLLLRTEDATGRRTLEAKTLLVNGS
jgi:hypothetical protein